MQQKKLNKLARQCCNFNIKTRREVQSLLHCTLLYPSLCYLYNTFIINCPIRLLLCAGNVSRLWCLANSIRPALSRVVRVVVHPALGH